MAGRNASGAVGVVEFGPFLLRPSERTLEMGGHPIRLGGRAFDVLLALVDRAGEVVSQQALIDRVWPDTKVDAGSLRVHIATLRKALEEGSDGARFIANVPGRGYCFVASVRRRDSQTPATFNCGPATLRSNLPPLSTTMVGRGQVVTDIARELECSRFVSLVGMGGIGKTTVAVSIGHALFNQSLKSVCFVDLATINDPRLVVPAIGSALNLRAQAEPFSNVADYLKDMKLLLILDNCEHVVDPVSFFVEQVIAYAPKVSVLTTSREPLRAQGEKVYHLQPLACPPPSLPLTAAEALKFPAVQLFVERVAAAWNDFTFHDADVAVVSDICRRVDGIALAIELASGRVSSYGLHQVAALLDGRFKLIWHGRRTTVPRQRTLEATLDWSFRLLTVAERELFGKLSVFVGPFTLEAAREVVKEHDRLDAEFVELLASLVDKSLVSREFAGSTTRYRLLTITHDYAKLKFSQRQDLMYLHRRHALYFEKVLIRDWPKDPATWTREQTSAAAGNIGNVRAALEWCYSEGGDKACGTKLVVAAAGAFLAIGLPEECRRWVELAISHLDNDGSDNTIEIALQSALSTSFRLSFFDRFQPDADYDRALNRSIDRAEKLGEGRQQLEISYNLCLMDIVSGRGKIAIERALQNRRRLNETGDEIQLLLADATLAMAYTVIGDNAEGALHYEAVVNRLDCLTTGDLRQMNRQILGQTLAVYAVNKWLMGYADQARRIVDEVVEDYCSDDNYFVIGNLIDTCAFVYRARNEWDRVEILWRRLEEVSRDLSEDVYASNNRALRGAILIQRGAVDEGLTEIGKNLDGAEVWPLIMAMNVLDMVPGFFKQERYQDALALLDSTLRLALTQGDVAYTPELLRSKGEALMALGEANYGEAEACLYESLKLGEKQAALGRQLRTAMSLAELWFRQDRLAEARDIVSAYYDRFSEGFDTFDLKRARQMLDDLATTRSAAASQAVDPARPTES